MRLEESPLIARVCRGREEESVCDVLRVRLLSLNGTVEACGGDFFLHGAGGPVVRHDLQVLVVKRRLVLLGGGVGQLAPRLDLGKFIRHIVLIDGLQMAGFLNTGVPNRELDCRRDLLQATASIALGSDHLACLVIDPNCAISRLDVEELGLRV